MDACLTSLGSEKILEPLQPGKRARMRDCSIVLAHWHRLGVGSVRGKSVQQQVLRRGEGAKMPVTSTWGMVRKTMQQPRSAPSGPCCIYHRWTVILHINYCESVWIRTSLYRSKFFEESDQKAIRTGPGFFCPSLSCIGCAVPFPLLPQSALSS